MIQDERKIVEEVASRRRDELAQSPFRRKSPANRYVIVGGVVGLCAILAVIYAVTRPKPLADNRKPPDYISERIMPKEEVTPAYIDSIGRLSERESKEGEEERKKEAEKAKAQEAQAQPAARDRNPGSMMILAKSGGQRFGSLSVSLGEELSAILESTVIADDRSVPVIARLTRGVKKNGEDVLPRNSRVFGTTQGMVENRVHVTFTKVVFPDGKEHPFSGIALDAEGVGGIPGKLKQKPGRRGLNIISKALIGASSAFSPIGGGFGEAATRGAHRGAAGEMMGDTDYYRKTSAMPVVTLAKNMPFIVLVDRAL